MARKTVDIEALKKRANMMLGLKGDEHTVEFRRGVIAMLEFALFESGQYKGFGYRLSEWDFTNNPPTLRKTIDDTRRKYN